MQETDLVIDDNIVFGCHVVSNVVIHNKTQKPVQQRQINLFIHLLIARLQHDITLALCRFPHILQIVDACKVHQNTLKYIFSMFRQISNDNSLFWIYIQSTKWIVKSLLTLAPFVYKQWRRLCVSWFDPGRKKSALVGFIPQILIQVRVSDLLQRFNVIHWYQVTVKVHELNTHLQKKKKAPL